MMCKVTLSAITYNDSCDRNKL